MARQVNIHEAKIHFSELIAAVERGEEVAIARRGKVVAVVTKAGEKQAGPKRERVLGHWARRVWADPKLFEPMPDEELEELYPDLEALEDVARMQRRRGAG